MKFVTKENLMESLLHSATLLIHFCIVCPYLFYKSLSVQGSIPVYVISLVMVKATHDSLPK